MTSSEPIQPNTQRQEVAFIPQQPGLQVAAAPAGLYFRPNLPPPAFAEFDATQLTGPAARAANALAFLQIRREQRAAREGAAAEFQLAYEDFEAQQATVDQAALDAQAPSLASASELQEWAQSEDGELPAVQGPPTISATSLAMEPIESTETRRVERDLRDTAAFLADRNPALSKLASRLGGARLAQAVERDLMQQVHEVSTVAPRDESVLIARAGNPEAFARQRIRETLGETAPWLFNDDPAFTHARNSFWQDMTGVVGRFTAAADAAYAEDYASEVQEEAFQFSIGRVGDTLQQVRLAPTPEGAESLKAATSKELSTLFRNTIGSLPNMSVQDREEAIAGVAQRVLIDIVNDTRRAPVERREQIHEALEVLGEVVLNGIPMRDRDAFQAVETAFLQQAESSGRGTLGGAALSIFTRAQLDAVAPILQRITEVETDGNYGDNGTQLGLLRDEMLGILREHPDYQRLSAAEQALLERNAVDYFRDISAGARSTPLEQESTLLAVRRLADEGRFDEARSLLRNGRVSALGPGYDDAVGYVNALEEATPFQGPASGYATAVGPRSRFQDQLSRIDEIDSDLNRETPPLMADVRERMLQGRDAFVTAWRAEYERVLAEDPGQSPAQIQSKLDAWVRTTGKPLVDAAEAPFQELRQAQQEARTQVETWRSQRHVPADREWLAIGDALGDTAATQLRREIQQASSRTRLLDETASLRTSLERQLQNTILRKIQADPELSQSLGLQAVDRAKLEASALMTEFNRENLGLVRQVQRGHFDDPIRFLEEGGQAIIDRISQREEGRAGLLTLDVAEVSADATRRADVRPRLQKLLDERTSPRSHKEFVDRLTSELSADSQRRIEVTRDTAWASGRRPTVTGGYSLPDLRAHNAYLNANPSEARPATGPFSPPLRTLASLQDVIDTALAGVDSDQVRYDVLQVAGAVIPIDSVISGEATTVEIQSTLRPGAQSFESPKVPLNPRGVRSWRPYTTLFFRSTDELEAFENDTARINAAAKALGIPIGFNAGQRLRAGQERPDPTNAFVEFMHAQETLLEMQGAP